METKEILQSMLNGVRPSIPEADEVLRFLVDNADDSILRYYVKLFATTFYRSMLEDYKIMVEDNSSFNRGWYRSSVNTFDDLFLCLCQVDLLSK